MLDLLEVLYVFEVLCLLEMLDLLDLLCVLQGFLLVGFHALKMFELYHLIPYKCHLQRRV